MYFFKNFLDSCESSQSTYINETERILISMLIKGCIMQDKDILAAAARVKSVQRIEPKPNSYMGFFWTPK